MGRIIPNWMESHNIQVPNHQPDILLFQLLTIINHRLTIDLPIYNEKNVPNHQPLSFSDTRACAEKTQTSARRMIHVQDTSLSPQQ